MNVFLVTVEHMQEQQASLRVWPAMWDTLLVTITGTVSFNAMHAKLVHIGSTPRIVRDVNQASTSS